MNNPNTITNRAYSEWSLYCQKLKLQACPGLNLILCGDDSCDSISGEGYSILADDSGITVRAKQEPGLLYGVFALIRSCKIAGNRFINLNLTENPAFETRMLWSWSRLDKSYRHAPYLNFRSLINPDTMAAPEKFPEMMRFIRNMAQMGVNSLAITHELHHAEIEDYDQHGFRPFYPSIRIFSEYLQSWGISLYLYTASSPEQAFKKNVADTDCSFDPRVQEFYRDFMDEAARELPGIDGFLLAGGLGGYAGGSLFDCTCDYCKGKSPVERVLKQIGLAADILAGHGKKLVYTVTTDLPFTMDREVDAVIELWDKVPENVILSFKDCYHDFEELRYPEHPLFSRLEEIRLSDKTPLAVEYQLFPEMRGKGVILSNVAGVWSNMFRDSHKLGMKGVIGVIETHPDNAHPSMADWYAWGRLCWNTKLTGDELLKEWALLEYPHEAKDALVEVLEKSFHAAGKVIYAKGVQDGSHGMIIPFPHFVRDILNDTWCPGEKLPDHIIGNDERQVWLYTEKRQQELRNDPELELFLHAKRVDAALTERLLSEKEQAGLIFKQMYKTWESAGMHFAKDDYRYNELLTLIHRNVTDSERFYVYFRIFLHWQGECLKDGEIDEARRENIGTGQDCSIYTCDILLDAFLRHLEMSIFNQPFEKYFEPVYSLPQYDGSLKLWQVCSLASEI